MIIDCVSFKGFSRFVHPLTHHCEKNVTLLESFRQLLTVHSDTKDSDGS